MHNKIVQLAIQNNKYRTLHSEDELDMFQRKMGQTAITFGAVQSN